jgi:glycosyltransferase involved in cell wall biosynthesis
MAGALVSIIMPFLNAERFISEAVNSVLAQTYNHWELLLVDDGSTDGSTVIAHRYAELHPDKIRRVEHPGHQNRGISASRNLGISRGKGEYIAMLDADDLWLPHKLEQQMALLGAHPQAAMLYGNSLYWHSWTGSSEDSGRDFMPRLTGPVNTVIWPAKLLVLYLRGEATVPCPSSLLLRRAVIERVNGFQTDFRDMYEDQVFYAKIALAAPVLVVDECWDKYRQHADSCCSRAKDSGSTGVARLAYLNWLTDYLLAEGVNDAELWQALDYALWQYRYPVLAGLSKRTHAVLWKLRKAWRRS